MFTLSNWGGGEGFLKNRLKISERPHPQGERRFKDDKLDKTLFFFLFFFIFFISQTMFRCVSSNLRLSPLYKRQCTNIILPSKSILLKPSQSFSTSQRIFQKINEQASTKAKRSDSGDIKRLFKLTKPEAKTLTGK
ncbi:MAG: hypothetical protein JSY10_23690 [Paenibacillus sp.]|nr:hypothetical protein [Paenibacillus sp.]